VTPAILCRIVKLYLVMRLMSFQEPRRCVGRLQLHLDEAVCLVACIASAVIQRFGDLGSTAEEGECAWPVGCP
jgi:hypothetical protein